MRVGMHDLKQSRRGALESSATVECRPMARGASGYIKVRGCHHCLFSELRASSVDIVHACAHAQLLLYGGSEFPGVSRVKRASQSRGIRLAGTCASSCPPQVYCAVFQCVRERSVP